MMAWMMVMFVVSQWKDAPLIINLLCMWDVVLFIHCEQKADLPGVKLICDALFVSCWYQYKTQATHRWVVSAKNRKDLNKHH